MATIPAQKNKLEVTLVSFVGKWIDATAEHDHRRPRGCDRRTCFASDKKTVFDGKLYREAVILTWRHFGNVNVKTRGTRHVLHFSADGQA